MNDNEKAALDLVIECEVPYFGERYSIPVGLNWLATDANGKVYAFKNRPYIAKQLKDRWIDTNDGGHVLVAEANAAAVAYGWYNTLCKIDTLIEQGAKPR